jgi:putative ABC transport system permease protein
MHNLLLDVRFAVRFLIRNKRSISIAIGCLACGIAMTTTVYGSVSAWVFKPLPWNEPEQLVGLSEFRHESPSSLSGISGPNYRDWVRESRSFSEIAAFVRTSLNLSTDDLPQRIVAAKISASLFPLLDEAPILGRVFTEDEEVVGRNDVILLSHELWRQRFAADPDVVGRSVRMDGRSHTIVGVMREGFQFPEWGQAWTPLGLPFDDAGRDLRQFDGIARLAPGVSLEQAQADMGRVARRLEQRYPTVNSGWGARVRSYRDALVPDGIELGLSIQLFASLFVLVIACANAANILLALAAQREREISLRMALGATRMRIVRQLLTESTLIGLIAGLLGALLVPILHDAMMGQAAVEPPYWVEMGMDLQVFGYCLLASIFTGLVFGLVPALRASRTDLVGALKEGGRGTTRGKGHNQLVRGLVAAELALSIVLLIGATLTIRSYLAMQEVDMGYDGHGVLTWRTTLSSQRYRTETQRTQFARELTRRLEAIPGVESAGAVNLLPSADDGWSMNPFEVEGQPVSDSERPFASVQPSTSNYLRAMRIDVLQGRPLRTEDTVNNNAVAVVSESMAARFWPGRSALGQRIRIASGEVWLRVVGVARDITRPFDVPGATGRPKWQVWVPFSRSTPVAVSFVLRTLDLPESFAPEVREQIRAIDADLPVYDLFTMTEALARLTWVSRLWGLMFAGLAVFALMMSAVGLYGVVSYGVSQRTHEVGVRLALGAQPRDVLKMIMQQGLQTTAIGALAGLLLSIGAGWGLSSLLFGVEPGDAPTLLGTTALLAAVSLLATYFPAMRATRVDPMVALRSP